MGLTTVTMPAGSLTMRVHMRARSDSLLIHNSVLSMFYLFIYVNVLVFIVT